MCRRHHVGHGAGTIDVFGRTLNRVVPQCLCRGFLPGVSVAVWSDALGADLKKGQGLAPLNGTVGGSGEAAETRFHGLVAVAETVRGTYVVATTGSFA